MKTIQSICLTASAIALLGSAAIPAAAQIHQEPPPRQADAVPPEPRDPEEFNFGQYHRSSKMTPQGSEGPERWANEGNDVGPPVGVTAEQETRQSEQSAQSGGASRSVQSSGTGQSGRSAGSAESGSSEQVTGEEAMGEEATGETASDSHASGRSGADQGQEKLIRKKTPD